jgi:predicted negative regulator of RcsB-dependent stress response
VLDSICASLHKAGLQERAGDLYLHLGRQEEALVAYRKGHAYRCVCLTTQVAGVAYPSSLSIPESSC